MRSAVVAVVLLTALVAGTRTAVAQAPDGQAVYKQNCSLCHGTRGVPVPAMAKALGNMPTFNAAFLDKVSADSMLAVLKNGAGKNMKSFKDKLSADQMAAVIQYIRTTFGSQ